MSFQNRMCCGRREGGKCLVAKEHDRELGDLTQFLAWHHFSVRCGSAEQVFPSLRGWILSVYIELMCSGGVGITDAVLGSCWPHSAPSLQCGPECAESGVQEMCGKNNPSFSSPDSWCCSFFQKSLLRLLLSLQQFNFRRGWLWRY